LTPEPDPQSDQKIQAINALYRQAPALAHQGEMVISTDELTGVQALERKHPGLPLAAGKVERREFEYIRQGTRSFIVNFEVATGQVGLVSCGPTRTEADFVGSLGIAVVEPYLGGAMNAVKCGDILRSATR
jgi:hypothetical protein